MITSHAFVSRRMLALILGVCGAVCLSASGAEIPGSIQTIMQKPRYSGATWALHVVDIASGEVIYDLNSSSNYRLLTGSVRKLYSVGTALNTLGAAHRFKTPVFRNGVVDGNG